MKRYETLFIVQSELPSEDITAIIERYSKIITDMKGTVLKVERWGKRKLAYLIRKQARGFYILIDFAGRRESSSRPCRQSCPNRAESRGSDAASALA